MHEPLAYEREPYRSRLETTVVRTGTDGPRPYAVLSDTIFYPEGGGQPADRGTLDGVAVTDVQKRDGEVRHYLARSVEVGPAALELDWARRFDHMQQHTAQHLLSAVAQDRFGWATTAFHLGEVVSDIELATPHLGPEDLQRLEDAVAAEVRAARPVEARRVPPADYAKLPVRSRGLPEGHTGDIRLVEIAGVDLNTCGGTHLRSTAEIEVVQLLGTESLRGGTRLFYAAGGRARRRLRTHEERNAALRAVLGVADEGLPGAVEAKLEQLRAAERRNRTLEQTLAASMAGGLSARPGPLVADHAEGQDAGFLSRVARQAVAADPGKVVFLTATQEQQSFFVLAVGAEVPIDANAVGKEIARVLGGRGGGSGGLFQGKAASLTAREAALAELHRTVPGAGV